MSDTEDDNIFGPQKDDYADLLDDRPLAKEAKAKSKSSTQSEIDFSVLQPLNNEDPILYARLKGYVMELRNGKPPKVINMVMKGVPERWRKAVFTVAGVPDPTAIPEDLPSPRSTSPATKKSRRLSGVSSVRSSSPPPKDYSIDTTAPTAPTVPPLSPSASNLGTTSEQKKSEKPPKKKEKKKKKKNDKEKTSKRQKEEKGNLKDVKDSKKVEENYGKSFPDEDRVTAVDVIESDHPMFELTKRPLLFIVFVLGALANADLSMIFPSLWSYTQDLGYSYIFYGLVAGAFNVGQIVSAPFLGFWADKRTVKEVFLVCCFLSFCGNLVYVFSGDRPEVLVMGRFLAGLGAGNVFVGYSYITETTQRGSKRNARIVLYDWFTRGAQVIAPAIGCLGVIFTGDGDSIFSIDEYSFPPMIMTCLFGVMFLFQLIHFLCVYRSGSDEKNFKLRIFDEDISMGGVSFGGNPLARKESLILLSVYFACMYAYWSFASGVFPFITDTLGWSLEKAYLFFIFLGVVFVVSFALMGLLNPYLPDHKFLCMSVSLLLLGCILLCRLTRDDIPQWQLAVAGGFIGMGFSCSGVLIPKMFSHMTGAQTENLGLRMSWFFCFSAIGRCLGPICGALFQSLQGLDLVGLVAALTLVLSMQMMLGVSVTEEVDEDVIKVENLNPDDYFSDLQKSANQPRSTLKQPLLITPT